MKTFLVAFLAFNLNLFAAKHAPHPGVAPGAGFCGANLHFHCHQIGVAMSCGCVPN